MVFCQECGNENPDTSKYCAECGSILNQGQIVTETPKKIHRGGIKEESNKYSAVNVLGVLGLVFFLPLALICGAYLYTRPEGFAKRRGKFLIVGSLILWAFYAALVYLI